MKIALDTNRYADLARGVKEVRVNLERVDAVLLPFVVVAELRCGFVRGNRRAQNDEALQIFLDEPDVDVLYADDVTTVRYASVYEHLKRLGTPIPTNDMWIAALCLQHNLTLYTRDAHFDALRELKRL